MNRKQTILRLLIRHSIAAVMILAAPRCPAQGSREDLQLIRDSQFGDPGKYSHYKGTLNSERPLRSRHQGIIARYNPLSLVLKGVLLGYQTLVSEQLARSCPYEITCSNFSKLAIEEYGAFKGIFISADRILRCNRIGLLDTHPLSVNPLTGAIIDPPNLYR